MKCFYPTIRKAIKKLGFNYYRVARKPLLSEKNVKEKLEYSLKYKNFRNRGKVLWSDEVSFQYGKRITEKCLRRRGERY